MKKSIFKNKKIRLFFFFLLIFFLVIPLVLTFNLSKNNSFQHDNSIIKNVGNINESRDYHFLKSRKNNKKQVNPYDIQINDPIVKEATSLSAKDGLIDFSNSHIPEGVVLNYTKNYQNNWNALPAFNTQKEEISTIFQDNQGNIWVNMTNQKLLLLKEYEDSFTVHLSTYSNFDGGSHSRNSIFQDNQGNLWTAGEGTSLEMLSASDLENGNLDAWTDANHGNLTNGYTVCIFQDDQGNLWSRGAGTPLQMISASDLKTNNFAWKNIDWKENSDDIKNNSYFTMFQDSENNIWTMSNNSKLKMLSSNDVKSGNFNAWTDVYAGNIISGQLGKIFQDHQGNLWSGGKETPLQFMSFDSLRAKSFIWQDVSVVNNCFGLVIFQDSEDNIWLMSTNSPLNMLSGDDVKTGNFNAWTDAYKGNILDGEFGSIFQDNQGNIWSIGNNFNNEIITNALNDEDYFKYYKAHLQMMTFDSLKEKTFIWKNAQNNNNSSFINGFGSSIFQDKKGNLWVSALLEFSAFSAGTNTTPTTNIKFLKSYYFDKNNKKDNNLGVGIYSFDIQLKPGYVWMNKKNIPKINDITIRKMTEIDPESIHIQNPTLITPTSDDDGVIDFSSSNLPSSGIKFQYSNDKNNWKNMSLKTKKITNVKIGTYYFRISLDKGYTWKKKSEISKWDGIISWNNNNNNPIFNKFYIILISIFSSIGGGILLGFSWNVYKKLKSRKIRKLIFKQINLAFPSQE